MINDILGANIRNQRLKLKWTQEKLADALCVTSQAVSRWENGTATPDIAMLCSLTGVFGLSLDELCGIASDDICKLINRIDEAILDSQSTYQSLCGLWGEVEGCLLNYPTKDELLFVALKLLRTMHDMIETDDQKEQVNVDVYKISTRILDFSQNDVYHSFANYNLAVYYDEQIVLNRCDAEDLLNAELAKKYANRVLYEDMHKTFYYTFGATTEKEVYSARVRTFLEMLDMSKRSCDNLLRCERTNVEDMQEVFEILKRAEEKLRAILS